MKTINNLYYPILNFVDSPILWEHSSFKNIWEKLTESRIDEENIFISKADREKKDAFGLIQKPTAKRLESWPICAMTPDDFENNKDCLHDYFNLISSIWCNPIFHESKQVEIVKGSLWDDMYYNAPEGFDDWLKAKGEKGLESEGIIIRPNEDIAEYYSVYYTGGKDPIFYEASLAFHKNNCVYAHINFNGFLSSMLHISDGATKSELERIARTRKISIKEAFFQEDMYNVLKYLYFKEYYHVKLRQIEKGETIKDISPYNSIKFFTDTPCFICDNKTCN